MLRVIDPEPFKRLLDGLSMRKLDDVERPLLQWIKISLLVVDDGYQRDVMKYGRRNVVNIAREFDWSKFSTVIVSPVHGGCYAIIDGQHRTTAAACRGITEVPCEVIVADARKQAQSFAAINSNITKMTSIQVHAARVAAGDSGAVYLEKVCADGGVRLLRYPIEAKKIKVGDTNAVVQIKQALERYGEKALRTSLQCITKTRDGNPGMVRGIVVLALCQVLERNPSFMNHQRVVEQFNSFHFKKAYNDACSLSAGHSHIATTRELARIFENFLQSALGIKAVA